MWRSFPSGVAVGDDYLGNVRLFRAARSKYRGPAATDCCCWGVPDDKSGLHGGGRGFGAERARLGQLALEPIDLRREFRQSKGKVSSICDDTAIWRLVRSSRLLSSADCSTHGLLYVSSLYVLYIGWVDERLHIEATREQHRVFQNVRRLSKEGARRCRRVWPCRNFGGWSQFSHKSPTIPSVIAGGSIPSSSWPSINIPRPLYRRDTCDVTCRNNRSVFEVSLAD